MAGQWLEEAYITSVAQFNDLIRKNNIELDPEYYETLCHEIEVNGHINFLY